VDDRQRHFQSHGFRWNDDGDWSRVQSQPDARGRLLPGDVLLVDEAGMLDQDTARALLTIADQSHARVAFVGDRHQRPTVCRGGVLDHAVRWARPEASLALETVHRFSDPEYAELSLLMRTGERSGEVFDALVSRGQIVIHASEVERTAALTTTEGLLIADTRDQVSALNAAIRDHRHATSDSTAAGSLTSVLTTAAGERIGIGDRIATRRNNRDLGVANRDCWTVTGIDADHTLHVHGLAGERALPATYVREHVELAYATTVHGAQGETVPTAHLLLGETTGAAAAYVGMTRGRNSNTAHLVADTLEEARSHWIEVFSRDRADLGPGHAAAVAEEAIERYGPKAPDYAIALQAAALREAALDRSKHCANDHPYAATRPPSRGIGR
jgi:ATP-dependent exoDNAse (exonuclease V) alpha subunit